MISTTFTPQEPTQEQVSLYDIAKALKIEVIRYDGKFRLETHEITSYIISAIYLLQKENDKLKKDKAKLIHDNKRLGQGEFFASFSHCETE